MLKIVHTISCGINDFKNIVATTIAALDKKNITIYKLTVSPPSLKALRTLAQRL